MYLLSLFLTFYLLFFTFLIPVFAQNTGVEITSVFPVSDKQAEDGDILILANQELIRANTEYDTRLFGVLQNNPLTAYRRIDNVGSPVSRTGIAEVNVTNYNGPIQVGDHITSSLIYGKGQKASRTGYVIGQALTSFSGEEGNQIDYKNDQLPQLNKTVRSGRVTVAVRIEYIELTTARSLARLLEPFSAALFSSIQNPERFTLVLRYIGAALIMLGSLILGFLTFSRSLAKAVEAVGRNPLARTYIYISLAVNIVFILAIAIIGLIAAIVILKI